jgi:hypothetical protein
MNTNNPNDENIDLAYTFIENKSNDENNPNDENINLAYTFMENNLKELKSGVDNLRTRASTFLAFGGVLLRFIIELSDTQPSYKLTKLLAYLTCFYSIFLLGWMLSSNDQTNVETYKTGLKTGKDIFLKNTPINAKKYNIQIFTICCELLFITVDKKIKQLNISIICLVFSAFFFTLNGVLVSCFGE